jgi:NAD(P)-dependent dehydrogenase (short-subunit alcohol dehydrogenase family)
VKAIANAGGDARRDRGGVGHEPRRESQGIVAVHESRDSAHAENGAGAIVHVAAATGLVGFPNWTSQCAAKHGVVGMTKAVALEFAKQNIRVNCVCPGLVRTPMLEALAGGAANVDSMGSMEPVGRLGRPEEVADTIVFLCSEGAGFIAGHALPVDGGMVAQ